MSGLHRAAEEVADNGFHQNTSHITPQQELPEQKGYPKFVAISTTTQSYMHKL